MTASAFADLLHARSTGPGKWMSKCPARQPESDDFNLLFYTALEELRDAEFLQNEGAARNGPMR